MQSAIEAYVEALRLARHASRTRPDYNLRCTSCSAPHWLDTSIPSEIWNQIAKDDELLCLLCIDERVAKLIRTESEEGLPRTLVEPVIAEFYFLGEGIQSRGYLESHGEVQRLKRELADSHRDVEEWEHLAALMRERERPWIALWQQETKQPDTLPDYGALLAWLDARCRKAEISSGAGISMSARFLCKACFRWCR